MVTLFQPYVPDDAIAEVVDTLRSRWIGQGPGVDRFEAKFSEKFRQPYCVSLNSGSAALETAYELVGIKPGDEVITTPLTATPTNIPLLRMGAKIVWADINGQTLCLDRDSVWEKLTEKTKAVVNVHLGGIENDLGDMPVPVISDAAQALGVFTGDYTCNSFQAIKQITTADGGMLVLGNREEYQLAKLMRWFGIDREVRNPDLPHKLREMTYDIEVLGYKRQMTDVAAAMGLAGLEHYDEVIAHRRKLFALYCSLLRVPVIQGEHNTYWLCTVLVNNRDLVAKKLREADIESNIVHVRNDAYTIFGGRASLPVLDSIESQYLCLPLHMGVTEQDVELISNIVNQYG